MSKALVPQYKIAIAYDGEYPCLCMGKLTVDVNDTVWDFGKYCLVSGGYAGFTADWEDDVGYGEWSINEHSWPESFPTDPALRAAVVQAVNDEVPQGCCGGCL